MWKEQSGQSVGVFLGLAPPGQFGGSHEIPLQLILVSCAVGQMVSFHLMLAGSAARTRRAGRGPQHRSKGHRVWKQGGPIFGRSRDLGPSNSEISGSGMCGAPGCEHHGFLAMACRCWTGFAWGVRTPDGTRCTLPQKADLNASCRAGQVPQKKPRCVVFLARRSH